MDSSNLKKLKALQKEKEEILKKIADIDAIFEEDKDNEECWPGHSSTRYQTANVDRQVLAGHLYSIEEAIKKLSTS